MRGGFGVFYDIEDGALNEQFGGQPSLRLMPPITIRVLRKAGDSNGCLSAQNGSLCGGSLSNDFYRLFRPVSLYCQWQLWAVFNPRDSLSPTWFPPHFRTPYAQNLISGFKYQATKDMMIEAVYVGSLSRKAIASTETNYALLSVLQQQYTLNGYLGLNPECARALAGLG